MKSYSLSAGSRTLKWVYSKDSSGYSGDDRGWVDGLMVGTDSLIRQPGEFAGATDCDLPFTTSGDAIWSTVSGSDTEYYKDADAAQSGSPPDTGGESCIQTIVESDSSETIKFHWKVSSEADADYLKFYVDDTLKDSISGEVDWQQKSYAVGFGIHTLKWVYVKNAMIRGLRPKKSNPQVCKQARIQWADNIFRRVWPSGDTASTGAGPLPHRPPKTFARHLSASSRCSALAGILRCSPEKAVGLCSSSQRTPGGLGGVAVFKEEVSEKTTHSFDIGQYFAAPQTEGSEVLPTEQYSYDLDTDQCFMAQSYRMSVYSCEGIDQVFSAL
jgi:hypothetical protein